MRTSERLKAVPASPIRKLVPFAVAAKKKGVRVYHLNIGDPDIHTPPQMLTALKKWKADPIGYSQSQGEPRFLDALRTYYHGLGFTFIDTRDIQVTSGGSEAISMAMFAVANPGDEILVFDPLYTNYNSYAAINGITLRAVPTDITQGFHLPDIEPYITKKTKAILYCNPNNPTGTVYTRKEVEMLVRVAKKYNLFLLSDEVYREITFDGRKQVSLLAYMREIPQHAIVLDSMSKRYNLCGVRLGALVSLNRDVMSGVLRIAQGRLSSGIVDQAIASELTNIDTGYVRGVRDEYEKRRDVLYEGLKTIPGITIPKPEGAFYAIVGLPVSSAEHFCEWLLTDFQDKGETVMFAPAAGFYATPGRGAAEVRVAYVLNVRAMKRCVELLRKALVVYGNIQKTHSV